VLISALKDKHKGQSCVVMCGGVSLPESIKGLSADVWISANQHGALLRPVDYIVYTDVIHQVQKIPMAPMLRKYGVPLISKRYDCDYRIPNFKFEGNSGMQAVIVACILECDPIIICGMDFYDGGTYFHDPSAKSSGNDRTIRAEQERIDRLYQETTGYNVRRIGCNRLPYPIYDAAEALPTVTPRPWMQSIINDKGSLYRVRWNYRVGSEVIRGGTFIELTKSEASIARTNRRIEAV
jgi:hypothetical protein